MSKMSPFIVVLLVPAVFFVSCWLLATEPCPKTKVKTAMCGTGQSATSGNMACLLFTCAGGTYSLAGDGSIPPCTSRKQIVACTEDAPVREEGNHPELTETGVDVIADQIVCYTYYKCHPQLLTGNCVQYGGLEEHKVSPLATFKCK